MMTKELKETLAKNYKSVFESCTSVKKAFNMTSIDNFNYENLVKGAKFLRENPEYIDGDFNPDNVLALLKSYDYVY